jgi:hypothetical protein
MSLNDLNPLKNERSLILLLNDIGNLPVSHSQTGHLLESETDRGSGIRSSSWWGPPCGLACRSAASLASSSSLWHFSLSSDSLTWPRSRVRRCPISGCASRGCAWMFTGWSPSTWRVIEYEPLHCQQQDVQSLLKVLASFIAEDMEEVIENVLQHGGPVQVPLACHQDLGLTAVSCIIQWCTTLVETKITNVETNLHQDHDAQRNNMLHSVITCCTA